MARRVTLDPHPKFWEHLDRLLARGLHGTNRGEAIQRLAERGLEQAMKDGLIPNKLQTKTPQRRKRK